VIQAHGLKAHDSSALMTCPNPVL